MATTILFSPALFWFSFLFFLSFLSLQTISQPRVNHLLTFCNNRSNSFVEDSSYDSNLRSALKYLRGTSPAPPYLSVTKGLSPDTVYGMYHCRVDITKSTCGVCVRTAITEISKRCTSQKEAFIFYEQCMVRYSDYSFFGLQELDGPNALLPSTTDFPTTSRFGETLPDKMNKLITRAASTTLWPNPYFSQDQQHVTELGSTYTVDSLVQCSPDLDPGNCTVCLRLAVEKLLECCSRSRSALNFLPKCLVRFNTSSNADVPSFEKKHNGDDPSSGVIKGDKIFEGIFVAVIKASALALVRLML
ncbi:unnamed protein product [Eruca vesicaria subsp. sativa]|uniref:Gnk2-homologous domain-containing protein n=1 Tax=Eruca vesicaria subsp. sativa TaxID=29727 RepID=A0ABC8IW68_ERUVS|nr:unnamed protein product [Eruca vesicaria subsp. sativa]